MKLLSKLKGGDLRSIGKADEVARQIGNNPKLFDEIFQGIFATDPIIKMRAADAIEKVSQKYPQLLKKHKNKILNNLVNFEQQEVKWHIALMVSYLELTTIESEKVFVELSKWANNDKSKIVRVNSMQALADISMVKNNIKTKTVALIKEQMGTGTPSLMSRGRKLLKQLKKN
ncbi:MAG: hypothetical protein GY845_27695 [Planctomycetes bacterium]|nr:hypothetical protein [Planctomycetota bacterium]